LFNGNRVKSLHNPRKASDKRLLTKEKKQLLGLFVSGQSGMMFLGRKQRSRGLV